MLLFVTWANLNISVPWAEIDCKQMSLNFLCKFGKKMCMFCFFYLVLQLFICCVVSQLDTISLIFQRHGIPMFLHYRVHNIGLPFVHL